MLYLFYKLDTVGGEKMAEVYTVSIMFREQEMYRNITIEATKENITVGNYLNKIHKLYIESKEEVAEKGR